MEWWIAASLIISNLIDDAIATICTRMVMRGRKKWSFILTVIFTYLVSWSIKNYAYHYGYVHFVAWSSGLGCMLGIDIDKWYRRREKIKNLGKARHVKKQKAALHKEIMNGRFE